MYTLDRERTKINTDVSVVSAGAFWGKHPPGHTVANDQPGRYRQKPYIERRCTPIQVEATTEKRPMVIRGNRLFFRDTKCTEITGRPDLTGICAMIS